MKKYCASLLLACISPLLAWADQAQPRPDVEELLTVMRVEQTLQSSMGQIKKMIPQMTANMLKQMPGATAHSAEKAAAMQQKVFALVEEEMSWPKIKGDFVQIYSEALTPEETKGIIAFYKSPAGQAFLDKQPLLMEKSIQFQQKLMSGLIPKMQALVKEEAAAQAKDAASKNDEKAEKK